MIIFTKQVIDEYYCNLLEKVKGSERPVYTACHHMLVQLPSIVQQDAVLMFTQLLHKDRMSLTNAALLLSKIKELMSEEGVPMDIGCGVSKMRYNAPKGSARDVSVLEMRLAHPLR